MLSYPLKNKSAETVLREIKKFIVVFLKPTIIQTDNDGEFNNNISDLYYENNNIKHIN